jgi:hypothetical protein
LWKEWGQNQLIELVRRIMNAEGTEEKLDTMLDRLEKSVPHPEVSDLIFWDGRNLTRYQLIMTPPAILVYFRQKVVQSALSERLKSMIFSSRV